MINSNNVIERTKATNYVLNLTNDVLANHSFNKSLDTLKNTLLTYISTPDTVKLFAHLDSDI